MKRFLSIILALLLLLTACSSSEQPSSSKSGKSSSPTSKSASEPSSQKKEPKSEDPSSSASEPVPAPASSEPEEPASSEESPQPSRSEENALYFSLGPEGEVKALHIGDALGGWTLQSWDVKWDQDVDGKPWVEKAVFTAPTDAPMEISCTASLDGMSSERRYQFTVAEDDLEKMPVLKGDTRSVWFAANNNDDLTALADLGIGETLSCRVAVSRYVFVCIPMMAMNGADIVWAELE